MNEPKRYLIVYVTGDGKFGWTESFYKETAIRFAKLQNSYGNRSQAFDGTKPLLKDSEITQVSRTDFE